MNFNGSDTSNNWLMAVNGRAFPTPLHVKVSNLDGGEPMFELYRTVKVDWVLGALSLGSGRDRV